MLGEIHAGFRSSSLIGTIFANPGAFYYNLHNGVFPAGAVRDQLTLVPEPSTTALALLAAGLAGLWARRLKLRA
jgi:hypothetical protein